MRYTLLSFLLPKHFCLRAKPPSSDASSQGTSVELYNGMYISQTIGQQSATGNSTKMDILLDKGTNRAHG
jgi:hypothetical protein